MKSEPDPIENQKEKRVKIQREPQSITSHYMKRTRNISEPPLKENHEKKASHEKQRIILGSEPSLGENHAVERAIEKREPEKQASHKR